jgi:hypothetical protein
MVPTATSSRSSPFARLFSNHRIFGAENMASIRSPVRALTSVAASVLVIVEHHSAVR